MTDEGSLISEPDDEPDAHGPADVRIAAGLEDAGRRMYVYVPEAVPVRRTAAGKDDDGGVIEGGVIRIDLGTDLVLNLAVFAADDLVTALSTRA